MNDVTPQQFAESVRAAIGTVRHFYTQIDRLNTALRDALVCDPDRLTVLGGLPPKPEMESNFRVIRYDYGLVYHGGVCDDEDDVDEGPGGDDPLEDGDDGETPQKKARTIDLFPHQPVLPVRILLYHPRRPDELEPQIVYAALTDWRRGTKQAKPKECEAFRIKRYMVARLVRIIHHRMSDTPVGERLESKATVVGRGHGGSRDADRALSARLCGPVRSVKLYDLDGSGAVDELATQIKAYWREHATSAAVR